MDLKNVILGYVKWPLFAHELGDGSWPEIKKGRMERPQTAGATSQQRLLSSDGSGYQRMLPEHAIFIAIDRQHVDPNCLTTDVLADLQLPVFLEEVGKIMPERINGQHRMLVFGEHFQEVILQIRKVSQCSYFKLLYGTDSFSYEKNPISARQRKAKLM